MGLQELRNSHLKDAQGYGLSGYLLYAYMF